MLEYNGMSAASAVVMSRILRKKKIIFVEGLHEGKLLENIFDGEIIAISAGGCNGVIEAVDTLKMYNDKNTTHISVIGFIDIDYLHIKDDKSILQRNDIIYTTYRDIEIDLIHSKSLRRYLEEKANPLKWDSEIKVANELLDSLKGLSYQRAYNYAFSKNWDFKWINISNYSTRDGDIDYDKLTSAFRQKNRINDAGWKSYIKWKNEKQICLKMITRGHDATCLLGVKLQKKFGNRSKEESDQLVVEENLRLAVERKFIEAYNWFIRILQWTTSIAPVREIIV